MLKIKKTIKFAPLLVLVVFLVSFASSNNISAISANSGVGHGTGPGIADNGNLFISTTGGARWEYYSWGSSDSAGGLTFTSSTTARIDGWSSSSSNFAIDGADVSCPEGTLGLWRYSFVALKDLGNYKKGHLVGVLGIDGNSKTYNSRMLGGDMNYVGGNWGQVEAEYRALLAARAVSIPWGGGSGLSWFCSSNGNVSPPTISQPTCDVDDYYKKGKWGKTEMITKIINTKLTQRNSTSESADWKKDGEVYAMPTDDIQWFHCYAAGVQAMHADKYKNKTLRKATVVGSGTVDYHKKPEHEYHSFSINKNKLCSDQGYSGSDDGGYYWDEWGYSGSTTMGNQWSWENWTNKWKLDRTGGLVTTAISGSLMEPGVWKTYSNGTIVGDKREEGFTVQPLQVGSAFTESTETGAPKYFGIENDGKHSNGWSQAGTYECKKKRWEKVGEDWSDIVKANKNYCTLNDTTGVGYCDTGWYVGNVYKEDIYDWVEYDSSAYFYNRHPEDYIIGTLDPNISSGFGTVKIPYNFNNSATISVRGTDKVDGEEIVYAGDKIIVEEASATVGTRVNNLIGSTYATIVRGGKVKLVTYATKDRSNSVGDWDSGLCDQLDGSNQSLSRVPSGTNAVDAGADSKGRYCNEKTLLEGNLNPEGLLGGVTTYFSDIEGENMVFDANAGDYMCFAIAIYPATSENDKQMNEKGSGTWNYNSPDCIKIAKKPYFGVYGGSIYTAAKTATLDTAKTNMIHLGAYDDYKYKYKSGRVSGNRVHFGSFAEQSVFGIDAITGLASGSAFKGNNGASNNNYCENLVPLTMANAGKDVCSGKNSNVAGLMGKSEETENVDKSAYTDFWLRGAADTGEIVSNDGLGESTRYYSNTGKNIYYTYRHSGDGGMGEIKNGKFWAYTNHASIPNGTTRLVRVDGNLEITDNIIYSESGSSISSAGDLPQVIIYATENISIRYNVERIDAMLIAGGTIYTGGGLSIDKKVVNDERLSYPLTVRGIMIADKLYLDRTYGAAAGYNYSQSRLVGTGDEYTISGGFTRTPAETINYDTSTILWARYMVGTSESNTMTEVYRTELAPRY